MRVLVYKRTHEGDPDNNGCFGVYDCLGRVRGFQYDAVIGVGGIGPEAKSNGISDKINWIGIGPRKSSVDGKRSPEVTFEHFFYFGKYGPSFRGLAPKLAKRIYSRNIRHTIVGQTDKAYDEVCWVISIAENAPPSEKHGNTKGRECNKGQCEARSQNKCRNIKQAKS